MTQEQAEDSANLVINALHGLTTNEGLSILVGCVCNLLENISADARKKHRDLFLEGITAALDGLPIYGAPVQ